ncbi:hydantoinase [Coniophora puteana RWD-64-598 SS2]|uniref:Hydantoinase n=1 Tax=Coniophora puteana (strain RWD-64-598) TaxID=741705 RepID=A0A5M3MIW0_CONPW|nr:hydantoinase [Coniophora puteana RWD-64-598 SS2]EIW78714.1 hydantoinase [Coniophora puteana RWD-64-598 SS2]
MAEKALRIGVDVGGTNTDAVLLDLSSEPGTRKGRVLVSAKHPTTPDVTEGIKSAVRAILRNMSDPANAGIQAVSIGTTHFVNALVERDTRRLDRVAVIRLCGPFTHGTPPFVSFPFELRDLLEGPSFLVSGGLQIDGSEIASVSKDEIVNACAEIKKQGIQAVTVVSVFAPIDSEIKQEETVAAIVKEQLPHIDIVCSKDVAHIGLLERENAAILNASLQRYARRTVRSFQDAIRALDLKCPVFITSNDGTLLSCAQAAHLPIRTFSSGPTNSMRGASFLASMDTDIPQGQSALVIDIGGTTTDIGVLLPTGFPRQAASYHELCGVRLNFSMPHVTSIGLGGGSLVREHPTTSKVSVGPQSVGHRITSEALVFGGSTLTATDVAVALGRAQNIGNKTHLSELDVETILGAQEAIKVLLQNAVDAMKTSAQDIPVFLVGGGSILAPDELAGVSRVHRFHHFDVANAVGAAIAQISGVIDCFQDTSTRSISEAQADTEAQARARAISAGADPRTVKIVESEAIPIAYTSGRCRFYVKAAGEWSGTTHPHDDLPLPVTELHTPESTTEAAVPSTPPPRTARKAPPPHLSTAPDILAYTPTILNRSWHLSETDLEWLADGCYILGCGGGGSPFHTFLELREMLRNGDIVRVVDLASVASQAPDALVGWGGGMGSPEVSRERLLGNEYNEASADLWSFMGIDKPAALVALEIGGGNGLINMITAATSNFDIPVVDGDFMGRAYPTWHQTTANVYDESGRGLNLLPSAISSGDGNVMIMTKARRDIDVDASLRAACVEMGTHVGQASRPLEAKTLHISLIPNTVSLAWRIGRAVALARKQSSLSRIGPILVDAVGGPSTARVLFVGKIAYVNRRLHKGHTIGEVIIHALKTEDTEDETPETERFSGTLKIPFKNENLYAEHDAGNGQPPKVVASVPDLISVLDARNGSALGTPDYKYGLRVLVLGITAAPQWTETERGLALGGPAAFGFEHIPYVPLKKCVKPKSVIEEFGQ